MRFKERKKYEKTYAWQRSGGARRIRSGSESGLRISRHAVHRSQRMYRGLRRSVRRRSVRRVGAQRKGGSRGGCRRVDSGRAQHGVHEACRRQCRRRPHVHGGLHRRQRRAGHTRRRRPRYAQFAERTGHQVLRAQRAPAPPRAGGQSTVRKPKISPKWRSSCPRSTTLPSS